jgi:hypothetical protein
MGSLDAEIDANFYNLVHQLATKQQAEANRRGADREQFVCLQRIALRRTAGIPDESEFIEVQCHDLTCGGFSFLLPKPPRFHMLVAAFGAPPDVIYVSARVAHTSQVVVDDLGRVLHDEDGRLPQGGERMYLVGCTFTERLHRDGAEAIPAGSEAS